jgi:translation initiation factor 1 (eIF-1/SUI1)
VRTERSGRRGKTVTIAGPFHLSRDDAVKTLKALKHACGCGGTLKLESAAGDSAGQTMEIQGDQVDRVVDHLARQGFLVKRG